MNSETTEKTKNNTCQHKFNYVSDEDAKTTPMRYCMFCGFTIFIPNLAEKEKNYE